ncbi:hypothetical protein EPN52_14085 [bacterium]|nr:MAG: hypothetical protein EPN52_14085 [bacterium]
MRRHRSRCEGSHRLRGLGVRAAAWPSRGLAARHRRSWTAIAGRACAAGAGDIARACARGGGCSVNVVVGVDAGGSKTLAVAAGDGRQVGRAQRGSANATSLGIETAVATILDAVREAAAGCEVDAICVGAAGASRRGVAFPIRQALVKAYPAAQVRIVDDAAIALRAGVADGPAVVVIAGTGSIGYAEDAQGQGHRAGGLGWLIGDEGSGYAVGLAALREAAKALDGRGEAQGLLELVREQLPATDREELLSSVYTRSGAHLETARVAALAEGVLRLAAQGDRFAAAIVEQAAADLGALALYAARAAGLSGSALHVVLAGGMLRGETPFTALVQQRVERALPGASAQVLSREPVEGALVLARR